MKLKFKISAMSLIVGLFTTQSLIANPTTVENSAKAQNLSQQALSTEIYPQQSGEGGVIFNKYVYKNKDNEIFINTDNEDYQNSVVSYNNKKYSLKNIYVPSGERPDPSDGKFYTGEPSRISQVFLLNNNELLIILSASRALYGMNFNTSFDMAVISIKNDGTAKLKGELQGLTLDSQAFSVTASGLELMQFSAGSDPDGNDISKARRLSTTYSNGNLTSKVVPYTKAYEKKVKQSICKMYLAHEFNNVKYNQEESIVGFVWSNIPELTPKDSALLKSNTEQGLEILDRKYCH
ncbi:hypothetical protein EC844_10842 [Acinetobacter calcoaceticus]|uniref:Uncharacterized protein n=1 Tax=Acinetobacter calcoaceticus TaxID=471 RepID=A0A4V2R186_ACICA|nr:hypothetical protein EC844_10842 [Acinetobacter calcoaceticus]